jgi:Protein of unknown function (DUF4031)
MSVYLDDANILWRGQRWCHLYADSLWELEEFGRRIGLRPGWLQHPHGVEGLPHYDVTGRMIRAAAAAGAVRVTGGDGNYRRLRQALGRGEYNLARHPPSLLES